MKTVFITRDLKEGSPFLSILTDAGFNVTGQSLIEFFPIPFQAIPKVDWIFFYSKNGVKYFFKGIKEAAIAIPKNVQLAAIGPQTATLLTTIYRRPDFVGNGNPKQTAEAFLKMAEGQNVLFPQAKTSLQSIQQLIDNKAFTHDLVVYENKKKQNIKLNHSDIVAFTSPMNAEAYFEHAGTQKQEYFAIGQTTAKVLSALGIKRFQIAPIPSEESLARLIIKSSNSEG